MVTFDSAGLYVLSKKGIRAQIAAIDEIIAALLITALDSAGKDGVTEYSLNDGQVQIRTVNRGAKGIQESILAFRRLKNDLISEYNGGRMTRLVDSKAFIGNRIL